MGLVSYPGRAFSPSLRAGAWSRVLSGCVLHCDGVPGCAGCLCLDVTRKQTEWSPPWLRLSLGCCQGEQQLCFMCWKRIGESGLMGSLFKKNCSPSPPLGENKGTCKLWVQKRLNLVFRHLSNRQLRFGGARLVQAVLALLLEGFTLTAAVFSMAWDNISPSDLHFCLLRQHLSVYSP